MITVPPKYKNQQTRAQETGAQIYEIPGYNGDFTLGLEWKS